MDVRTTIQDQRFVWDSDKALSNLKKHGVSFEEAAYVFFDPWVWYVDAGVEDETRDAAVGKDGSQRSLFVVFVLREDDCLRIVSAREAGGGEGRRYEEHE